MRLKEDSQSWKSSGIMRRDFRHDPGLPETEIPKRIGKRKKKHEHQWGQWVFLRTDYYTWGRHVRRRWIRSCQTCGQKEQNPRYG